MMGVFKRKRRRHKKVEKLLQETSSACLFPSSPYDVSTKGWPPPLTFSYSFFILFFWGK